MNSASTGPAGTEAAQVEADRKQDLTGHDRMARNVLANWAGHSVFIIAGFITPRMMDRFLGQEALGVWDFTWSLVAYFGLVQMGTTSSVGRYVAKYRAGNDQEGVNRAVSSVFFVFVIMAVLILIIAISVAWMLPSVLGTRLGHYSADARWMVFLLGAGLAAQVASHAFYGVITGSHRWDIANLVLAGSHAITVAVMIATLVLGGGLVAITLAVMVGEVLAAVARCVAAYHVDPGLSVRISHARWSETRQMLAYGLKMFLYYLADLLEKQATSILVAGLVGPAALAVFARPQALVRHVHSIVFKCACIVTPTASAMQAAGQTDNLKSLLVTRSRLSAFVAIPLVLTLAIMGGPILRLWMGPHYEQGVLLGVLALGSLLPLTQMPTVLVLAGLNAHGRPGLALLLGAVCSAGLTVLALAVFQWGLMGAALGAIVPALVTQGIYFPLRACRVLRMGFLEYAWSVFRQPLVCAIPFALCLLVSRWLLADTPLIALGVGLGGGGAVLCGMYWRYALEPSAKARIFEFIASSRRAATPGRQ